MPKSSMAMPTPIARSSSSTRRVRGRVGHQLVSVISSCERLPAARRRRRAAPAITRGQLGVEQAAGRDVHRDAQVAARSARQRAALPERRRAAPSAVSGVDQAGLLGERDEAVRRDQAELRMLPAHERLDAVRRAPRASGDLGLVLEDQLAALDRRAAARRPARGGRRASLVGVRRRPRRRERASLARYSAMSRARSSVVGVAAVLREARRRRRWRGRRARCRRRRRARRGRTHAAGDVERRRRRRAPGSSTANSSPPSRATHVSGRQRAAQALATARSRTSPRRGRACR